MSYSYDDPFLAEYSPSELSEMIGVSKDSLRDWRRRGLIDNIGQKDGKRGWKYSVADAAGIWTALFMGILSNFELAKLIGSTIAGHIILAKHRLPIQHYDYALDDIEPGEKYIFSAQLMSEKPEVFFLNSLADAPKTYSYAQVINIAAIYGQMPSDLREALFVADIDGKWSGKEAAKSLAAHRPQDGRG